ncbi:MAG: ribosome maturation factor RimM [Acidobacteriota bacterium]|nr:ribosome maturation factor RimM [Acidobacteriota bacterium]
MDLAGYRHIGSVQKPHGLKGEFTVFLESDLPDWVAERKTIYAEITGEAVPWAVKSSRFHQGRLLMKVDGLPGRNEVEAARGTPLYVDEEEARAALTDPDFFYNSDLIGMAVVDTETGTNHGTVRDVIEMPAQNLLEVERSDKSAFLVPFTKAIILEVDHDADVIRAAMPEGLADIQD